MAQFSNYTAIDAPADADIFLVYDDSAGATRKVTLQQLGDYIDTDQGFVTGPGSSTDNAVARFDSTTGKIVQASGVIIDDSDNVTGVATLTATTLSGTLSTATQNSVTTMTGLTTVGTIATGVWEATDIAVLHGGTGASTAADARTNLGLAIGTNVQAYDAGLASIAGLTTAADKMIYTTASDTYAVADLSSFARTILDDADALTARATLGLVIGTNVQAYSANLAAVAALAVTDGNIIVGNGSTWVAESGATARTSLGLGTGDSPTFAGLTVNGLSSLDGYATSGSLTRSVSIAPAIVVPENGTSAGIYSFPTFSTSATGTHALIAGTYLKTPTITDNGAAITDAATLYIEGMPTSGASTNLALFIGSGNSRIRDKLGVGAVTLPDATLTVYGPSDTNYTAKFRTSNVAAPYGVAIEEASGGASGYPLLVVVDSGFASEWFSVTSGTGLTKIRTAQVGVSSFGSADTHTVYGGTLFSLASGSAHIHLQRTGTSSGDVYIGSVSGDVRFGTSAGGSEIAQFGTSSATFYSDLTLASGSITSASGAISFGNENLSTTGTFASGAQTVSGDVTITRSDLSSPVRADIYNSNAGNYGAGIRIRNVGQSWYAGMLNTLGASEFTLYDNTAAATRLSVSTAGNFNFQAGSITTTGTLASGNATVTGTLGVTGVFTNTSTGTSYFSQPTALVLGTTATSSNAQFYATKTYSAASGDTYHAYFRPEQSVASTGWLFGSYSRPSATHTSGTVASVVGYQSLVEQSGAGGTVTALYGIRVNVSNLNATAVTTSAYGLRIESFTATGTITNRWAIYSAETGASYLAGSLRIGTTSAAGNEILRVNGLIHSDSDSIIIDTDKTPSSASDTGTAGQVCFDQDYVYRCVATNTWKRAALSTWP